MSDESCGEKDGRSESDESGDDSPPFLETVALVLGVALTVALFGYLGVNALTMPSEAPPHAQVEQVQELDSGVEVTISIVRRANAGLSQATVTVDCGVERQVEFSSVPANDPQNGTVVCPPDSTVENATVTSWVPA